MLLLQPETALDVVSDQQLAKSHWRSKILDSQRFQLKHVEDLVENLHLGPTSVLHVKFKDHAVLKLNLLTVVDPLNSPVMRVEAIWLKSLNSKGPAVIALLYEIRAAVNSVIRKGMLKAYTE